MTMTDPGSLPPLSLGAAPPNAVDVEIVVPVFNEERDLDPSVRRLHAFLAERFPFRAMITIADNASSDGTWPSATELASTLPGVRAVHLDAKGRGRALAEVWRGSSAEVVAYMDVDLSTDLNALLPLVAPLLSGHSDVAIGTRLTRSSRVARGSKREVISRCYNLLLHATLGTRFSDAQCGFKAMRADCARALLPHVLDTAWFFDTELLVLAERSGLRIAEVPVDWIDDPDSRVDIRTTAVADLRGIARVGRALATGRLPVGRLRTTLGRSPRPIDGVPAKLTQQVLRFGVVGVFSTLAYLLLFLVLRPLGAQPANLAALLLTAVGNTAVNRRYTFGISGPGAGRAQVNGLVVFGLGLALTSGSLWALAHWVTDPARALELIVVVTANLTATVLRFVLLREWVFARRRPLVPGHPVAEESA